VSDLKRDLEKYAAMLRAKRALQRKLEDIDWKYETLLPALEEIKVKELPSLTIEVVDEDSSESQ